MSESKRQYQRTTQERANKKKNVNQDGIGEVPQISKESEQAIVKSAKNINKLADIQEKSADDLKDVQKIMKKVVDKNQQLQHTVSEQISKITHNFELALHEKGKSANEISEVGNYIAKELRTDIEKVINSEQKLSREEIVAIEKQMPHFDDVIKSIDSANDGEIKQAKELRKLLQDSINQRKQIDLNLPKLIGKEIGKQSLNGIENGFSNIESSFISAVSEDPLTAKMASGIFWLIRQGTSSVWNVWEKQKKHKEEIAERLRGTQEALVETQLQVAKDLHDAETEHLKNIEKAVKESSKKPFSVHEDEESPIERFEPAEMPGSDIEIDPDYIKSIAFDVSAINRRAELAAQNDAEEALERAERNDKLLDAIHDLTDATKSQKDKKKKGLLKGIWDFIAGIPARLSVGIGSAITAMVAKIKGSKLFTMFSGIGKWVKGLKFGEKLASIKTMILKPVKMFSGIGKWVKGLKFGEKLASIGKLILKPFQMIGKFAKMIFPIGKLVSKFGKMIPFVGQIITAIEGIFGFFNAKEILGKDTVTIMDRFASAIGGIFEGFGEVADMLLGWFGFETDIKTWLNENFTKPLAALFNMDLSEIWDNMVEFYSGLWSDLTSGLKDFFSGIFNWENLKETLTTIWDWTPFGIISNLAGNIYDFFTEKFSWENTLAGIEEFAKWSPMHILADFGKKARNWLKNKFSFFGKKDKEPEIVSKPVVKEISKPKPKPVPKKVPKLEPITQPIERDFKFDKLDLNDYKKAKPVPKKVPKLEPITQPIERDFKFDKLDLNDYKKAKLANKIEPNFWEGKKPEFLPKPKKTSEFIFDINKKPEETNSKPELLPTEKFNINSDRPIELDALKMRKEIEKIGDIGKNINIPSMPKIDASAPTTPMVLTTSQAAPRDNDPHIQYMNQVFAP